MAIPRGHYLLGSWSLFIFVFKLILPRKQIQDLERAKLIKSLRQIFHKENVLLTSSCRMALFYIFESLKPKDKFEVLLTPITIPDIVNAIIISGGVPVFVDMDLETHGILLTDLRLKINSKTRFILLTDLSGIPHSNIDDIKNCCIGMEITIINDVSQSYRFQTSKGLPVGIGSDFIIGSFSSGKYISSLVGGFIATADPAKTKRIENMRLVNEFKNIPQRNLIYYAKEHFIVNFLTNKIIFTILVFPYLFLMSVIFKKNIEQIQLEREIRKNQQNGLDLFFDIVPKNRQSFPDEFFSEMSDQQAWLANECIKNLNFKLKERKKKVFQFFLKLDPNVPKSIFCRSLFDEDFNHYHLPCLIESRPKQEIISHFLRWGVDLSGYGLNLCHREEVFKSFFSPCPNADIIKLNILFLPVSERSTRRDLDRISGALNALYAPGEGSSCQ